MTIDELQDKRFYIILEALLKGIQIEYRRGWNIFYKDGQLYQTHYNQEKDVRVTHKSEITLHAFIKRFSSVTDAQIKDVYGSLRLYDLQKRLTSLEDNESNSGNGG